MKEIKNRSLQRDKERKSIRNQESSNRRTEKPWRKRKCTLREVGESP
jgi:hypothetical protein